MSNRKLRKRLAELERYRVGMTTPETGEAARAMFDAAGGVYPFGEVCRRPLLGTETERDREIIALAPSPILPGFPDVTFRKYAENVVRLLDAYRVPEDEGQSKEGARLAACIGTVGR